MQSGRRAEILRAAQQIMIEQGAAGLSVRNVAARAGLGPSTLRHYFPSQNDLYEAVLEETFNAQLENLRIADTSVSPALRLTECMSQFLPEDDAQVPALEVWFASYAATLGPRRSEKGVHLLATLTRYGRKRVDGWLAVLDAEGALRHSDRQRHATLLFALIDGFSLALLTPESLVTLNLAHSLLEEAITTSVVAPTAGPAEEDDIEPT